ncbi:hypothetical protein BD779DRAFT_1610936 [Infundibulicybe gibba]|nr:hypothetical protein BD779DRAFT_1610936 [Infundibulicybe gibba]
MKRPIFVLLPLYLGFLFLWRHQRSVPLDPTLVARCSSLHTPAGPLPSSPWRSTGPSDRYVPETPPTLIRNARIWTGVRNGTEIVFGDVLLQNGRITALGYIPPRLLRSVGSQMNVLDAHGMWVTPGLVDLHSHLGVQSAPLLSGASDGNSRNAPILPWLRSVDGLNTHDDSYRLTVAGGVTTAQILPGSANNIGGQSFLVKLRPTSEKSSSSMLLEPPSSLHLNNSDTPPHIHWRHMKHACGENPDRRYSQTRMDAAWNFRSAYANAARVRDAQDEFCARIHSHSSWWRRWFHKKVQVDEKFPEDYQWEALVDVLRGRVKLSIHCYEAVDLDAIVRLSNEFKFPVASFHHAGETYLVPDLLKKTWGGAPTIALFASNFNCSYLMRTRRKKREAYRGSEFAPRVLAEHGIPVVMKSDHPVLNSRYLLYEAQQAHYYGLSPALALASITSTPADAAGVGHRVGRIAEDIVLWNAHPLALGATPVQVYIDGIAQLPSNYTPTRPPYAQKAPHVPDWEKESREAVEWEGVPPLRGRKVYKTVRFVGVQSVWMGDEEGDVRVGASRGLDMDGRSGGGVVVVGQNGELLSRLFCDEEVDLQGGSLAPGFTTFGAPLDSSRFASNPPQTTVPSIIGDGVIRAVDGLMFEGRNMLLAYRGGVTRAITAPLGAGFMLGCALIQGEAAVHVAINLQIGVSVSTQIAALRNALVEADARAWVAVRKGDIPLVVHVDNADIMATLIGLKSEVEKLNGRSIQMTFVGATEAHLIAEEIRDAGISVILTSPRPFPGDWDHRRIVPGPPLSRESTVMSLLAKNVTVAVGVVDESAARNTRFELGWVTKSQAIRMGTRDLEQALGLRGDAARKRDLVAYAGGDVFGFDSKVVGVVSVGRGQVELF